MPVRKRKGSPFFWYSFSVNGNRFRGSTGHTEKSKAKEVERDQYQLAKQSIRPQGNWDLQTVLSAYYTEHAAELSSAADIERTFADLQRLLGKKKRTALLTSGDLMDYRAKRRGEERGGRSPKAHSINREFAYLRAAYQHCERFHGQAMPRIDWKALKAAEPTWRTRFLGRQDEAPAFLAVLPANVREIVICAIVTGLRKQNILALDWRQVSLSERTITVVAKGNKETKVTISPVLMAILSTKPKRKGKVFDTTNFRRRWDAAVKEVELANFRFHDLRHTFASWARKNGADLPTLKEALNHSDISMTMRYANVSPDEVETAFDQVSATLMGTIAGTEGQKVAEKSGKAND